MSQIDFKTLFSSWKTAAESLDKQLHCHVHIPVDLDDPELDKKLEEMPHPADKTGSRQRIQMLFDEIIDQFPRLDSEQRQQVIDLMNSLESLMWSACISSNVTTEEGYRRQMILLVIHDQGKDTRDFMMALAEYRRIGEKKGYDVDSIFREMSTLASPIDKFGWGTTRALFLTH